jgi:hypothetical protein
MTSDQNVPLSEALERFSDPADWNELCSLEPYALAMFVVGGPQTEDEGLHLHYRYHWLKQRVEAEFLDKLITGSLRATGVLWPVGLDPQREAIPGPRWQELDPDSAASEATGGGLRIVKVSVESAWPTAISSSEPRSADEPVEHASLAKLRRDLRRWLEREAAARGRSWYKRRYLEAARSKYGTRVTDNLFREVWRLADLPRTLREPGLRKARYLATDSSPPD